MHPKTYQPSAIPHHTSVGRHRHHQYKQHGEFDSPWPHSQPVATGRRHSFQPHTHHPHLHKSTHVDEDEGSDECFDDSDESDEEEEFRAASAPDNLPSDTSASPAALFLSFFSPVQTPAAVPPDTEGQQVAGYTLGPVVGYGGFSTIRRAVSSTGATVAIKIVRKSDVSKQQYPSAVRSQLDNEVELWTHLSHEHILPLFAVERTKYADFFITLLCPAGSLYDILKRDGNPSLPQDDAGTMFRQVVRGLSYLHNAAKIVHCDMKLENVLVDEMGTCRITDFGLAQRYGSEHEGVHIRRSKKKGPQQHQAHSVHLSLRRPPPRRTTIASVHKVQEEHEEPSHHFQPGSLPYAAPELLEPSTYSPHPAQDIWALGVMLYSLFTGRLPFQDPFEPRLQMKILHGTYEEPRGIGHGAVQVLKGCLNKNAKERWTVEMVDDVAWGVGWGEMQSANSDGADVDDRAGRWGSQRQRASSRSKSRSRARPYSRDSSPRQRSSSRGPTRPSNDYHHHGHSDDVYHSAVFHHHKTEGDRGRRPQLGLSEPYRPPPVSLKTSDLYSPISSGSGSRSTSRSPNAPPLTPIDFDLTLESHAIKEEEEDVYNYSSPRRREPRTERPSLPSLFKLATGYDYGVPPSENPTSEHYPTSPPGHSRRGHHSASRAKKSLHDDHYR